MILSLQLQFPLAVQVKPFDPCTLQLQAENEKNPSYLNSNFYYEKALLM